MGHKYVDESGWDKVADALNRATDRGELVGLDTEFAGENYDVRKMSPAGGRAHIHMWSVAVKRHPLRLTPRGYHAADAAVMLAPSLTHPRIRAWFESDAPKVAHNLSVDFHVLTNAEVSLRNAMDTLEWSRWVWPERARGRGYSLDSLGVDVLGTGKTADFAELFSETITVQTRTKLAKRSICSCGADKCRLRKGHAKTVIREEEPVFSDVIHKIPLDSVVPGHRVWERAVAYAARDAVLALNLSDVIAREMERKVVYPW